MTLYGILAASARASQRRRMAEHRAALRAQQRAARETARATAALAVWNEKERKRLYIQSREEEAEGQTEELENCISELTGLLANSLGDTPTVQFHALKQTFDLPAFSPGQLAQPEAPPSEDTYLPESLSILRRLVPSLRRKHENDVAKAGAVFQRDLGAHAKREAARRAALAEAKANYERSVKQKEEELAKQHAEVRRFEEDFRSGVPQAISQYFGVLLETRVYPDGFPQSLKVAYVAESTQLVIEYDLPTIEIVPDLAGYRYVKAKDEIVAAARPLAQRRALYASVLAQVPIRTLREVFESEGGVRVTSVVFNGHVNTIDPGTGKPIHPCLISLRATKEAFEQLDLQRVEPLACLKALNAAVSKSPSELTPVRPVLEFKMVDPRFIAGTDVLSELDRRPNLMELSPSEFEALIANLFEKMGLETRQTRASRDGGVDCVAYDPRPILGGKVVIQAKRYRNTVGVSAVRDLFGTLQNEGASKGILVTTSGYGRAAFEFAEGKPIELLSGSNLLYLLAEHTGVEAKIVVPEDWKDPVADTPGGA